MENVPETFTEKLVQTLNDEETDLYVLTLHYRNKGDLEYFTPQDQEKIRKIFDVLIKDTKHHSELLERTAEMAEKPYGA